MPSPEVETPTISYKSSALQEIYHRLYQRYGPQHWWPGDGPLDVIIGAILTQSAAWPNVEQALHNLKQADCWSLEAIHRCPQDELAAVIRPCGYFNTKARKLKAFAEHIIKQYGGDLEAFLAQDSRPLRAELLSIYGIGPETADDILVYAAEQPSFVIDSYTVRILQRLGLSPPGKRSDYHSYQDLFHAGLPQDVTLFNEYHALLDQHAKQACTRIPKCQGCCLIDICQTGSAGLRAYTVLG
jgi:endonuclease-3 related protein